MHGTRASSLRIHRGLRGHLLVLPVFTGGRSGSGVGFGVGRGVGCGAGVVTGSIVLQQPTRTWRNTSSHNHDAAKFRIDNERGKTRLKNLKIRIMMFTTVDVFIRNYCPYCSVHNDDNGHDGHWPFIIMPRKFYRTLTSTSSIAISPIGWPMCLVMARILMTSVGNWLTLNWTKRHLSPCSADRFKRWTKLKFIGCDVTWASWTFKLH